MRILHVNSYYVSRLLYKNIYDYQVEKGNDIAVFVPVKKGRIPENFDRGEYTKLSFDFNELDRYVFHLKHYKIYNDIKKSYPAMDFDLTHAHSLFSNGYISYKLYKEFRIPYVVIVRNTDVNIFFKKLFFLKSLGNKILLNAARIIFLSDAYKEYVIDHFVLKKYKNTVFNKSLVIPNGIDAYWFKNRINNGKSINRDDVLHIISIGTLDKNKNFETSRKVIDLLVKKGLSVKWTVIGKIIDNDVYNAILNCPYAIYKQPMLKEKLINEYRENDILLMPSINETFGLVYPEAMTQGLPVIYTKGQGFDKHFNNGEVGFAVNCFDYNEIANSILIVLEKYHQISCNCLQNCLKFNWNNINEQYINLYDTILNEHNLLT